MESPRRSRAAAEASGLVVRRQGHIILDGLNIAIPYGQVTGLLGPSGCGKTTLMRTLADVQMVSVGQVRVLGLPRSRLAEAIARTESRAVQFMPAFVLPQALLCGIVVARDQMTDVLRWLSDVLPLSYAVDAMQQISAGAAWSGLVIRDVGVILGFTVAALAGGALTLRRRTR